MLGSFIPGRKPKLWIKNLTNSLSYFFPGVVRDKRGKPRGSVHESLALDLEAAGEVHDANRCLTTRAAKSPNRWLSRQSVDQYLGVSKRQPGSFLFGGRRGKEKSLTTRQYARLVSTWTAMIGLDASLFGTHSLRRTKATLIYRKTGKIS